MPIGVLHSFKNESNATARMISSMALAGLEMMFLEIGQPLKPDATSAAAPRFGVELKLGH